MQNSSKLCFATVDRVNEPDLIWQRGHEELNMIAGDLGALGDRADLHVLVIDVPAFLAGVGRSAAGECGQALMIPPIHRL
jgi:hypothetical protein